MPSPIAHRTLVTFAVARTQFRSVSGLIPRSAATDLIVASGRDSYSATASAFNCGG
nr:MULTISPECIES: hypothetical protein [Streptomyces]